MSRDILSGLPDATRGEILSFMTFFKGERARTLEALDGDFEDCLEDRIRGVDPPFSLEDVTSAVDHLQVVVKDGVERDLKKIVNMNVLLLKNLLATAQQRGVRLRVDTSVIEDEALLRQVDALKLTGGSFSPAEPKGPSASFDDLTSKEEQKALERTNDRLVADNTTLQKDLRRLQAQSEQAARDQADLADEVRRLRKELRASSPVWKSTTELVAWTFVSLHAIEPTWPRGQCRVDGVESPRHRADAATESTSRRWRGAPEI
jgi:hypothetical protein